MQIHESFFVSIHQLNPCMVSTLNDRIGSVESHQLEAYIRSVLQQREILPGMEAQLQRWSFQKLSERDQKLLDLLQDAIETGYVRRITVSPVEPIS
ncbi:hypothetical protein C7B76_09075 [filamentous cyanobacterium CCP2]|nr:hypothetical protein C7B76_09075 [filamentous cyanobacterium CCP2]